MKLMIAIPCTEFMHYRFAQSLAALTKHLQTNPSIEYDICVKGATLVHLGREELARRAIAKGYTHVLWLDCDMVFDETIVDDLLETMRDMKCDLVTGICRSRHGNTSSVIFSSLQPDERVEEFPQEAFRIEGCGMACCLMTVDLLNNVLTSSSGVIYLPTEMYSEDLAFCYRAKEIGAKLAADPRVKVGHITQGIIWPDKSYTYI